MDNITLRSKLRYFLMFVPFRLYFVLFTVMAWLAQHWLKHQFPKSTSSFSVIIFLLMAVIFVFVMVVLSLFFFSVLIPYLKFRIEKNLNRVSVSIETSLQEPNIAGKLLAKMKIQPLYQPLFGFLYYRIVYDGNKLSPKFSAINTNRDTKFFNAYKEGIYHWPLPEIKEYQMEKIVVYFEDLFQFFSFAATIKVNDRFFTTPIKKDFDELNLNPKKTEEQTTRIEELRRVEGEHINYKNFEGNDDVRRIVWKIYAKNKELIVRTPEVLDPFASHLYLYASYQDGIGAGTQTIIAQRGLNYFKTAIWSIYKKLKQQGFDVRYIPDQETKQHNADSQETKTAYIISTSHWQTEKDLKDYVNVKDASAICISSLTPVAELTALLDRLGHDVSIIFVKLSNGFKQQGIVKWVRWIFLQEEKEADNLNLMQWNLSSAKRKMYQNEKAIEALLKGSDKKVVVV